MNGRGDTRTPTDRERAEWFDPDGRTGDRGLRFSCTMCGNCCSGPEGFVLVSDEEARALATRLGLPLAEFRERYTRIVPQGVSLTEVLSEVGNDCVFLDRRSVPGKALCGVYEDRPAQCRTWPFWPSVVRDRASWERHKRVCPGMDTGTLVPVDRVRILRDSFRI
ncbi:MAG: YkgJ family cysteine cluster protein [Phycisphaeraceae bacterium]|nr:MAG: YkgJ family cysteine cluster protein [Phycisphaeraceae bacterium]